MNIAWHHPQSRAVMRAPSLRMTFVNRWAPLARIGIVGAVLCLSSVAGWYTVQLENNAFMILAAVLGAFGLFIGYRLGRYEYGILAIALSAGLMNFFTLPTGRESRIVISLLLAMLLIVFWLLNGWLGRESNVIRPAVLNKPLIAFVGVNVIAYLWSNWMRDPLVFVWSSFPTVQLAALLVNILLPLLALFVSNRIRAVKWLRWLTWSIIGLGALKLASELFHLPTTVLIENGSRGLFSAWVGAMAYGQALFNAELSYRKRGLLLVVLAVAVYYYFILHDDWLSGWLPMAVACVWLTWRRSKGLFVLLVCCGLLYLSFTYQYYFDTLISHELEGGSAERPELWETNLRHLGNHPLFGMGPAGYAIYNMTYNAGDARSTHNNYFDVLSQTGIVGFSIFIWLMLTFLRIGFQTCGATAGQKNFSEAFAQATLAGTFAALVGMMLGDWVLPFAYNQTITGFDNAAYTWMFLGGMVSLYHSTKAEGALAANPPSDAIE